MNELPVLDGILPWTRSCFVCGEENPNGLRLRSCIRGGRVGLTHTARPADAGYHGLVHGGLAGTLLDEVMTWAAIISARRACVAAEFTTRLRKPIGVGTILHVEGWVTGGKSRLVLTEGSIRDGSGLELASATGKYVAMPEEQAERFAGDFVSSSESIDPRRLLGLAAGDRAVRDDGRPHSG